MIQLHLTDLSPTVNGQNFQKGLDSSKGAIPNLVAHHLQRYLYRPVEEFSHRGGKRIRASVIEIAFRVGSQQNESVLIPDEIVEFVELLHAGSLVIDDVQDESRSRRDRRSMHLQQGVPLAINTGNWMYFAALEKLMELAVDDSQKLSIMTRVLSVIKTCHEGQSLDLSVRFQDVAQHELLGMVERISDWKTGALTELAAWLGAVTSGASFSVCQMIGGFGKQLGVALQMQNDFRELQQTAEGLIVSEDLSLQRATWCWAWLSISLPPSEYQRLVRKALSGAVPQVDVANMMLEPIEITGGNEINSKLQDAAAEIDSLIADQSTSSLLNQLLSNLECRYV